MKTPLGRLLSTAAFCAALSPMLSVAHADYNIKVDCHGTGGLPDWSHTDSRITVWAKINGAWNNLGSRTVPSTLCDADYEITFSQPDFSAAEVDSVSVSISGSDAFWIDQIRLSDSTGVWWSWGANNNSGWCVSTDSDDGFNSYCASAAKKAHYFDK